MCHALQRNAKKEKFSSDVVVKFSSSCQQKSAQHRKARNLQALAFFVHSFALHVLRFLVAMPHSTAVVFPHLGLRICISSAGCFQVAGPIPCQEESLWCSEGCDLLWLIVGGFGVGNWKGCPPRGTFKDSAFPGERFF